MLAVQRAEWLCAVKHSPGGPGVETQPAESGSASRRQYQRWVRTPRRAASGRPSGSAPPLASATRPAKAPATNGGLDHRPRRKAFSGRHGVILVDPASGVTPTRYSTPHDRQLVTAVGRSPSVDAPRRFALAAGSEGFHSRGVLRVKLAHGSVKLPCLYCVFRPYETSQPPCLEESRWQ